MSAENLLDLSVIWVNTSEGGYLEESVRSLQGFCSGVRSEFIVVDNTPPDAFQRLAEGGFSEVKVISQPRNLGYATGCQRGLREARGSYILFLNPDTKHVSGSARELLTWMGQQPRSALAGPRVLNPDGSRQFSCRSFPTWATVLFHRHSLLTRLFPDNRFSQRYLRPDLNSKPAEVDWASGCCLLARKCALDEVGGFDEGYFLYFEDVDLACRLRQAGWKCIYYPDATFVHGHIAGRAHLFWRGTTAKYLSAARYFSKNILRSKFLSALFLGWLAISLPAWAALQDLYVF